jgi:DNA-binding GntR family transcriptional regulator
MVTAEPPDPRDRLGYTPRMDVDRGTPTRSPGRRTRLRLSDEVADYVREQIILGQIRAGEYVRPEKIAEELELSATPAREGLLSLQAEGFLRVVPRRGFVAEGVSASDVQDIFVGQGLLAGELAARATDRLTDHELTDLAELQAEIESAAKQDDLATVRDLNDRFHRAIYRAADSPRLLRLLQATLGYAPRLLWTTVEKWPDLTVHDHRAVLDALRERDPAAARATMQEHLVKAGAVLADRLRAAAAAAGEQRTDGR